MISCPILTIAITIAYSIFGYEGNALSVSLCKTLIIKKGARTKASLCSLKMVNKVAFISIIYCMYTKHLN